MPAVADDDRVAAIERRADVATVVRQIGERGERVEDGERAGVLGEHALLRRDLGGELGKQAPLQLAEPRLRAEELVFLLFQLRGHETLGTGECLFPNVVVGNEGEIRLRDLDAVAGDAVVPHFERADAGALPFARLQCDHPPLAVARECAQLVDLGIGAVADDGTAGAQVHGRLVDERRHDPLVNRRQRIQRRGDLTEEAVLAREPFAQRAGPSEGDGEPQAIARRRPARPDPTDQALEIAHARERGANVAPQIDAVDEPRHGIETATDRGGARERRQHPASQQPAAHRGGRAVDHVQQRAAALPPAAVEEIQVGAGGLVEDERVVRLHQLGHAEVVELAAERRAEVRAQAAERREAGRADGGSGRSAAAGG